MQNLVKLLIIALLCFGCSKAKRNATEEYVYYVHEIIHQFEKKIKKERGLQAYGSGGSMPFDVESISVSFSLFKNMSIEDARKLEVDLIEELKQMVTAHAKIRPFLREYPFNSARARVSLSFYPKDEGNLVHVFNARDTIFYYVKDSNEKLDRQILEEPFEEAYQIVHGEL